MSENRTPHRAAPASESRARAASRPDLGFVLTGGGARGAYQVGVLRWLARHYPDLRVAILTGVSAGAVNTVKLAAHTGTFSEAVDELATLWQTLTPEQVFRVDPPTLVSTATRWGLRLTSGGATTLRNVRGFLDTAPLRELLERVLAPVNSHIPGIQHNIDHGTLEAVAVIATSYSTGQTVSFIQGRDVRTWTRPQRRTVITPLTIDHVMASAALPIFFPAVPIGDQWYGDGGIRLAAPLSPALHLGANRILAISTRYDRTQAESDTPTVTGYPPPAQVLGVLLNAMFLDLIDQDAVRLERLNTLLEALPPEKRDGMRPIDLLVVRPSRDLARLAATFEPQLPRAFRFMTRGLGTRETRSPDVLSMLMFQPDYIARIIQIGEEDAERRAEPLGRLVEGSRLRTG
jgi:NTE family protein